MIQGVTTKFWYNYFAGAIFIISGVMAVFNILFIGLNDDTNILMHGAFHLLQAHELYEGWLDVSPPLIMMLYAIPAAIITWFNIPLATALHGFASLLCIASLSVTNSVLKRHNTDGRTRIIWLCAASFALFVAPQFYEVFADREHFLFIFALPWIIQMLMRLPPVAYTAAIACIGFCIKPYNIIIFAIVTLLCGSETAWRRRIFSVSNIIIGTGGILYLGIICFLFPGYIKNIMPVALLSYGFIKETTFDKNINVIAIIIPAILLCLLLIGRLRDKINWLGFLAGAYIVYMFNGGWYYTRYLLLVPAILLCFSVLCESFSEENKWYKVAKSLPAFIVVAFILCLGFQTFNSDIKFTSETGFATNHNHMPAELYSYLEKVAGKDFILLSTTLWGTNIEKPVGYPHSVLVYDYLWPLPWLYANKDSANADIVKRSLFNALHNALKGKPVLIVDESTYNRGLPKNTDILSYFRNDSVINDDLSTYQLIDTINRCSAKLANSCKFSVWKP